MKGLAFALVAASIAVALSANRSQGGGSPTATRTLLHDPGSVMREPDHFAWQVLCKITNPSRSAGAPPAWESWTSALRLYADPKKFDFGNSPSSFPAKGGPSQLLEGQIGFTAPGEGGAAPTPPHVAPSVREDVSLNRDAVKYILDHQLISVEGQEDMARRGETIDFPKAAVEIKTMWRQIAPKERSRFIWQLDENNVLWGLRSMHITTKDIPNWFWATFEHTDNYAAAHTFESTDTWGFKNGHASPELKRLLRTFHMDRGAWLNYRLGGSQTEFCDGTGRPVIRGNNLIEGGLHGHPATQSSCMTCHARSTVDGILDFHLADDRVGTPNPSWFYGLDSQNRMVLKAFPRDFVWSLARAKHKNRPPESIFWWIAGLDRPYYAFDIEPLFTKRDRSALKSQGIDLSNSAEVARHFQTVRRYMAARSRWSDYLLGLFDAWKQKGAWFMPGQQ